MKNHAREQTVFFSFEGRLTFNNINVCVYVMCENIMYISKSLTNTVKFHAFN